MTVESFTSADRDLLKSKSLAHFATLMADGSPQTTPVWIDVDENGFVLVNTAPGRTKDRNVRRDPRVALSITDLEDPYRWILVRGRVVETRTEGAWEHINELSMRYRGEPYPIPGERVVYRIEPERIARSSG